MKSLIIRSVLVAGSMLLATAAQAGGKEVYAMTCAACHGTGVMGAPKLADKAAWAPRMATGAAAMHSAAIKGKGVMPAKGGNSALSDADVIAAVDFMLGQAK